MKITTNRKAYFEYFVLDTIEAGIVLQGTEVKSIRAKGATLDGSYAIVEDGELWLVDCHIDEYSQGNVYNHTPKRRKKLLLKKCEIKKFAENAAIKGNALIPLSLYFKDGRIKVELGMCKGKQKQDKRAELRRKESEREIKNF